MSKVNDFISEAGVFYLATVDGDQPKVRPLGAHMEMDGKLLFGVGDFKDVYKQMLANPQLETNYKVQSVFDDIYVTHEFQRRRSYVKNLV